VNKDLPPRPQTQGGWTKYYENGTSEAVAALEEDMLVFDVEALYKKSLFMIMACAASSTAWYAWLSPWLLGKKENSMCHLVPLGDPGS